MDKNIIVIVLGVLAIVSVWVIVFTAGKKYLDKRKQTKEDIKAGKDKDPIF